MLTKAFTSTALTLAVSMLGMVGAIAPTTAEAQAVEEVVVTGSRIKRSDLSSISAITVLTEQDMLHAGNLTLEDFLQDQPSTLGGADYGSSVNNGNPGLATVQMRGLGPNRTLVLINGQRPAQADTSGYVDLNMIPTAVIERVEILRDGASTIYGSDAIAGVVNIITKKNFEGLQMDVGFDETSESDGKQYNLALTFGTAFDRGHIMISGQYTEREAISQKDRGFSNCPRQDASGGGTVCGGSGTTTPAQIITPIDTNDVFGTWVIDQGDGMTRPFNGTSDAYNFAIPSLMVTPQTVYSLWADARYMIFEEGFSTLNATMEAGFTNRESDQNLAAVGTFWAPGVPMSNPLNPFGTAQCAGNPNCSEPQDVNVARRLEESGGRSFSQDTDAWRIVLGLDGEFNNGWAWNAVYNYNDWSEASRDGGRAVEPRINGMIDPLCEVNTLCTPLAGTGIEPWDIFNKDTLTQAQLDYGTVSVNEISKSRMRVFQLNFTGDVMGAFELPGGEPAWALGYENREEKAENLPDGGSALGAVFSTPGNVTKGRYDVDEIYGEIHLPILSGVRFAEVLTLEASFRWSDYDFVDDDTTYSYKVEWAPVNQLRLRGSYSDGFRAPNISERFLGVQRTAASYADPCQNWDTLGNATIQANCGPGGDNLPLGFVVNAPQATTLEGGTEDLSPETAESYSYGFVWTPTFVDNLSLTMDYWDIDIEDAIGTAGTGNVIDFCYNSVAFSDPLCALIAGPTAVNEGPSAVAPDRRNALNQVTGVLLTNQNLSSFETSGWDFQVDYAFDTDWGNFQLRAVGTYVDEYKYTAVVGGEELSLAGTYQTDPFNKNAITTFPEWAVNYSATFSRDNWGAHVMARWTDSTDDGFDGSGCGNSCEADDVTYIDLQGWYEWDNMTFTIGARNITDEDPPYVTNYDDMNTLHYSYDTAGAYYYGRFTLKL